MVKCLNTQLKEVVNNDALVRLGAIRLTVMSIPSHDIKNNGKLFINVKPKKTVTIKVNSTDSQHYFLVGNDSTHHQEYELAAIEGAAGTDIYFSNGDYTVDINDKYDLINLSTSGSGIHGISFNAYDLHYSNLERIVWADSYIKGKVKDIDTSVNAINFIVNNSKMTGSLQDLPAAPITQLNIANTSITGNIIDLAKLASTLTVVILNDNIAGEFGDFGYLSSIVTISKNNIYGTVESFVNRQLSTRPSYANGVVVSALLPRTSLGGKTFPSEAGTNIVVWDSSSKIAVLCGGANVSSATRVYCKGYTQAEAEARWSGKAITRVED